MKQRKTSVVSKNNARFLLCKKILIEAITLQSPRGRIIIATTVHFVLAIVPYSWLANLSLYKLIGIDWAPSIGLTRAYWLLLHGDLAGAWQRNALLFPVLAVMWSIVALDVYKIFNQHHRKV